jgi:DNA primase
MSGRIPESFIEELMNRIDIVDVIEPRVPLKRAGSEHKACCPFHQENTPSFTVSPRKQFYHCFGCGAHGTAVGFLMEYDGLEFVDAVEELAHMAGLEVPREAGAARKIDTGLYEVLESSAAYFQARLKENPAAIEYLKKRGLSGEICRDFSIGFAPEGWNNLLDQIGTSDALRNKLLAAGMLSRGDKGTYDKFRNRIMFPIHDRRGRVIAFGGRDMGDKGPKYLNSPETELFHKGRELYGLYLAKKRSKSLDRLIVVEGYMDVVALAQYGMPNTVATQGTATTPEQVEILFRNAPEIIYCFDGDRAGRKAAWRALESTLQKLRDGRQARFMFLPEGEDPDSMVRRLGAEDFSALLEQATPLSEFFFQHFIDDTNMDSVEGRARLVELARPYLEQLPGGVLKEMLTVELGERARHKVAFDDRKVPGKQPPGPTGKSPMRDAIALLLQKPALVNNIPDWPELRSDLIAGQILLTELIDFCSERPNITTAQILEHWRGQSAERHLGRLAAEELHVDASNQVQFWHEALLRICFQVVSKRLEQISESQRAGLLSAAGKDEWRQLVDRKSELQQQLEEL